MTPPPLPLRKFSENSSVLAKTGFPKQRNYSFTQGQRLEKHVFRHAGVKPFACQHCSYPCSQPKGLIYHMLSHTGEKPFLSKQCNYSGKQSRLLKRHIRNHSGEKSSTCNQLEFVSSKEGHLRMHLETKGESHTNVTIVNIYPLW